MKNTFTYDLTVATVCRNALNFLPRCLASVRPLLSHPSLKVEHLLVDGASTDGTLEYLQQELAAGHISRCVSEPDKGLYDAMNKAIALAAGKVIVFINADDEICPDTVPACCEPILSGRAGYTVASAVFISDAGEKLFAPCLKRTLWRQPYCHQSMYCSTELLRQIGGFQWEQFRIGADTQLMRRLYIARIPCEVVPGTASRFHDGGVSSTPAVISERYELMLHFAGAYKDEVAAHPAKILTIIKHMRRYAVQKILTDNNPDLKQKDCERLSDFFRTVTEPLSSMRRVALYSQLLSISAFYKTMSLLSGGKNRSKYTVRKEISQLFAKNLLN